MKLTELLVTLETFAPLPLQESYDNAGLQVGLTEAEISRVLLCLDVTPEVVDNAIALGCNLIVAHHPLIFHKLRHITDKNLVERCVIKAIQHNIAITAMHTNLDNAPGGVNFKMAEKLGLQQPIFFGEPRQAQRCNEHGETECVCGASGVIGSLLQPMNAKDFIDFVKQTFGVECAQCNELLHRDIQRVALCGGAGSFLLDDAVAQGADAFITGEMSYHQYFGYEQKIQIAVIGHYQSEQFTSEIFKTIIEERCKGVTCYITDVCTNPILYL